MFNPDTILGTIDTAAIDRTPGTKAHRLPGGSLDPRNLLSGAQVAQLVDFAVESAGRLPTVPVEFHGVFEMTDPWSVVCTKFRNFASVRGNSFDFPIVEWIIVQRRKVTAHDELSVRQRETIGTCTQALSGVKPHFDQGIQARINASSQRVRDEVLVTFMRVNTRGEMDVAMRLFTNLFGSPAFSGHRGTDIPLSTVVPALDESVDSSTF